MAKSTKLCVMISSRCDDSFVQKAGGRRLSEIRKEVKAEIESEELLSKPLFEVWINEEAPPKGGTWDSWDTCMQAVKDCDVLVCLVSNQAGWAQSGGDVGICHSEMMKGVSHAPGKVRIIQIDAMIISSKPETPKSAQKAADARNQRFKSYVNTQSLFHGGTVKTEAELKERIRSALYDAVLNLAQSGVREASRGKFHSGDALEWSHLDFNHRRKKIREVLNEAIQARGGKKVGDEKLIAGFGKHKVLIAPDAIPAAFSTGPAKELVGQPFLRDHETAALLDKHKCGGPLHIIGCHKTATETQATKLLGFPDATVVSAPFGVFVADNIQKVQFAFIVNCRDETTTRYGLQRFFEWLEQTGEIDLLATRALSRAKIVKAIAREAR